MHSKFWKKCPTAPGSHIHFSAENVFIAKNNDMSNLEYVLQNSKIPVYNY